MDYKEKLRLAKEALDSGSYDKETIEYIFPELKESEDERIRKVLIHLIKKGEIKGTIRTYLGVSEKDMLAWLEKQGEQKVVKFMTKSYITPNPEFFQWIYDRLVYQHHENPNMDYMRSLKERIEDMQEIVNVKADNILVKQNPAWSKENSCYYDDICEILINLINSPTSNVNKDVIQKDLDWLMSIEESQLKSTWSEEDEKQARQIERIVHNAGCAQKLQKQIADWLKSLKERYTWKPSDEQIEVLENVRKLLHANEDIYSKANSLLYNFEELIRTLKKLREE